MRHIANLHAGEAKTCARDEPPLPELRVPCLNALRSLKQADEQIARLSMLCRFNDDPAA
ncbi:hypothetical protein GWU81_21695 [Salmonella enterica]|nr:hypothetical protein [Salmonella enterica]